MDRNNIMVSICMITYNHENYISEAIEGVLMQKTDFPIELIIGEDCSTDNTRKIVAEYALKYPDIIRPLLPEMNLGMMKNFIETMQAAKGKYIALCEGDDYWTDPYKLQKQVDFLEANDVYSGVCSNFYILKNDKLRPYYDKEPWGKDTFGPEDLLKCWTIHINTLLFRNGLISYLDIPNNAISGDIFLVVMLAHKMPIKYQNELLAVYRKHDCGVSAIHDKTKISQFKAKRQYMLFFDSYFKSKYSNIINKQIHWDYTDLYYYFKKNRDFYSIIMCFRFMCLIKYTSLKIFIYNIVCSYTNKYIFLKDYLSFVLPHRIKSYVLYKIKNIIGFNIETPLRKYFRISSKIILGCKLSRQDFFDYFVNYAAPRGKIKPQFNIKIDLVINAIEKDLDTLPLAVAMARENILHTLENVYIVTPDRKLFRQFCAQHGCTWVNETDVLPFKKSDILYKVQGVDRSGWLYQQLLKLNADKFCTTGNICLLDADTIITRPRVYIAGRKRVLEFSDEFHLPYFKTYEQLTGLKHRYPVSFVCHTMLFEREKLAALRLHVENVTGKAFNDAIIDAIDNTENSFFSEFELYANFVLEKYKNQYTFEYWFNQSLKKENIAQFDYFKALYEPSGTKSISFHSYNS